MDEVELAARMHTLTEIARVRSLLEARIEAGGLAAPRVVPERHEQLAAEVAELEAAEPMPPPLALVRSRFGLHRVEHDLVVLALALELDEPCARHLATLRGGARHGFLDLQVGLALFADDPAEAAEVTLRCDADGVLFRSGLLVARPVAGFPPYRAAYCLQAPRHLLHFALGRRALDTSLAAVARHVMPALARADLPGLGAVVDSLGHTLAGFYRFSPRRLAPDAVELRMSGARGLVVSLCGVPGSGRRMAVRAAARMAGRALIEIDGARLSAHEDIDAVIAGAFREAELYSEVLHLRGADALLSRAPVVASTLAELATRHPVALVVSHEGPSLPAPLDEQVLVRARTPLKLAGDEPQAVWLGNVPSSAWVRDAEALAELAAREPLLPGQIARSLRLAAMWSAGDPTAPIELVPAAIAGAAAAQRGSSAGELVTLEQSASRRTLDDIILSAQNRAEIEGIIEACANRTRVMRAWGFERLLSRGTGIICLFDGPPGTGKTLTAEVIARRLSLELHQINVSRVVDKYIGETEKNLEQLFFRTVPERTLLLFDEADSLFGKRVNVSTSTDRYANMAINTLLQLIERYSGLVVLTTNLKESMDPAFERRITYKVKFDKPDRDARLRLWKAHLPADAPLARDVDLARLADDFELAGGNIKNVVLRAALECAASGAITQAALDKQARREATSMGMLVRR